MTEAPTTGDSREQQRVRDAYGLALLLVLTSALVLIAAGPSSDSAFTTFAAFLQLAALIVTLRVSGVRRQWSNVVSIVALTVFLASFFAMRMGTAPGRLLGVSLWAILVFASIAAVARRLMSYRQINLRFVMGLLVVYVLLGTGFGLSYLMLELWLGEAFAQGQQGAAGAVYYSFITLATVGYGDISPKADLARALAVAEAIIGQLYLVSVVSLAVSRLGTRRQEP